METKYVTPYPLVVNTWTNGYGLWHASVTLDKFTVEEKVRARRRCQRAIRRELEERGEIGTGYRLRVELKEAVKLENGRTRLTYYERGFGL